jgi:hypothetical protein
VNNLSQICLPGLNIQAPWSSLILEGKKLVETRSYPIPTKYKNVELAIIETPGPDRLVERAHIIGVVVFSGSIAYESFDEWSSDYKRHLVEPTNTRFRFVEGKQKFGWVVARVEAFSGSVPAPLRKGIRFTAKCPIPRNVSKSQTYPRPLKY